MTQSQPAASPPPASGVRQEWSAIPAHLRAALEQSFGSTVVTAQSQALGFSPGVAARLQLADGRRIFVKAAAPLPNPDAPVFHRREGRITAALPRNAPVPRLLWSLDDAESGWIVLAFDDVEGWHPAQPWQAHELERVLAAMDDLAAALTPSPLPPGAVRTTAEHFRTGICGWQQLAAAEPGLRAGLDAWSLRHLAALAAWEASAPEAVAGDTLLHFDLRADNMLLTPERVWFVDWPHASVGAAWVDVLGFAPSVAMQGGPPPEQLLARCATTQGADPDAVTAAIISIAGFFTHRSLLPPPPGLPTLRAFQAAQGVEARAWIAARTGWA